MTGNIEVPELNEGYQNMPLWSKDYSDLKATEKQQMQKEMPLVTGDNANLSLQNKSY